jgi:hypothetical protein
MSLDVYLMVTKPTEVYWANITHNLNTMAVEAGIYDAMWRPEAIHAIYASEIIDILEEGLSMLLSNPEYFKQFNPDNGWGNYGNLISFTTKYLEACKENPDAEIHVSR